MLLLLFEIPVDGILAAVADTIGIGKCIFKEDSKPDYVVL